jgi:hypothetical protein
MGAPSNSTSPSGTKPARYKTRSEAGEPNQSLAGVPLHSQARQLAQHGGDRDRRAARPVSNGCSPPSEPAPNCPGPIQTQTKSHNPCAEVLDLSVELAKAAENRQRALQHCGAHVGGGRGIGVHGEPSMIVSDRCTNLTTGFKRDRCRPRDFHTCSIVFGSGRSFRRNSVPVRSRKPCQKT